MIVTKWFPTDEKQYIQHPVEVLLEEVYSWISIEVVFEDKFFPKKWWGRPACKSSIMMGRAVTNDGAVVLGFD